MHAILRNTKYDNMSVTVANILALAAEGHKPKQIARKTKIRKKIIKRVLKYHG